uniref:HRDC domain-containing protein n=1 Tax=Chlamydomonas euryale TaxID=1486919 RepID=A0A7R9V667_9CHLO|mmetsp:Transcript_21435/g.64331  ORF Transcript_21435/g.64331 Transcript_21435/m.64331 type:complete len:846 (+) Transcript_21435:554-3091(+)
MLPQNVIAASLLAAGLLTTMCNVVRRRHHWPKRSNNDTPFVHLGQGALSPIKNGFHASQQQHPYVDRMEQLRCFTQPTESYACPVMPATLSETSLIFVRTRQQLADMARALSKVAEFAVDTEHHARRSYAGFTCLFQASTGDHDWVVDTIALARHMHLLRDVLADPRIVKVAHGCANDVLWLQHDFHLYLVNVFDTERACFVLGRQQRSLAHLLQELCGVKQDKSFQQADWSVRPLSREQIRYARTDVHYLCFLAGKLRAELQGEALEQVHARSLQLTMQLYHHASHETTVAAAASHIMRRHLGSNIKAAGRGFHAAMLDDGYRVNAVYGCVIALCGWRDTQARKDDVSIQLVLPDVLLLALAQTQPRSQLDMQQLLGSHPAAADLPPCSVRMVSAHARKLCRVLAHAAPHAYLQPGSTRPINEGSDAAADILSSTSTSPRQSQSADARRQWLINKFSAKSVVYQNARMLSREGELLCHCDMRKIEWYLGKGIATLESDNPPTIRLLFEHKNADELAGSAFYSQSKANRCVVCGECRHWLRYRVVPSCYRRFFPAHLKSHRSHDIVLLCVECHIEAHKSAEAVKRSLAAEFDVPLLPPKMNILTSRTGDEQLAGAAESSAPAPKAYTFTPGTARRAALALQKASSSMPEERVRELQDTIKCCLGRNPAVESSGLRPGDLEAALLDGLGRRKRSRLLRNLGNLQPDTDDRLSNTDGSDNAVQASNASRDCEGLLDLPGCLTCASTASSTLPHAPSVLSQPVAKPLLTTESGHWWHGSKVVDAVQQQGGDEALDNLIRRFRSAFLEHCQPKFLPQAWTIDHTVRRQFGDFSIYRNVGSSEVQQAADL